MSKRDGPITRQKERIAALRLEIAELNRKGYRLTVKLEEAEAALEMLTGKPIEKTEPTLLEGMGP